jgi:O-antigen/teichoic acid export membrane protein
MSTKDDSLGSASINQAHTNRLERRRLQRVISNALSILTSDVLNRATTFIIYALVARYLGAFEFGQLSLALTLFYTFQVMAGAGLKTLITREVAKDRTKTDCYLVNGSVVVVFFSLGSLIVLKLFLWLMAYSADTTAVILLLSLGLFPFALAAVCEGVLQAWERMNYIAYANVPANLAKIILAYGLMLQGRDLNHLIVLIVVSLVAVVGIEWWLLLRYITRPRLSFDLHFSLAITRTTVTFLGIDIIIAIWAGLNIILLSKLASEIEVGLFSAAAQLMVPVTLIFQSIVVSLFPLMCQRFNAGAQGLQRVAERLIEFLLIIALPTAVGLFFLSDSALLLLYGEAGFLQASAALRIMVGILVLRALTTALGHILLAGLKEKITLRIVTVNAVLSLVLGLIFITQFGLVGAAIASLLTAVVNYFQHYGPVSKLLPNLWLSRLVWKPVVAVTVMAFYLILASDQGLILTVTAAGLIYMITLITLEIWSSGGPQQFRAKYRFLWST